MASSVMPVQVCIARPEERICPPWCLCAVLLFGALYGLVHTALRLSFSHNLSLDDASANVLGQTLALGYQERQPPLYEWLLWSVQQLTGPGLTGFLLIKYSLLTATFVFLYLAAQRLFEDRRWVVIASLSPLLLYQIGWNLHEGVTHSLAMTCAIAASFWAFMRLVESGRLGDYVLFGVVAGIGLLTKYGFAAYLIILCVCALIQPTLRARLFDRRMLASVALAAAIVAPFGYWLIANDHDLVRVFDSTVAPMASDRLTATMTGLAFASWAPLGFLFPLDLILLVMFPALLREGWSRIKQGVLPRDRAQAGPDWPLLLLHMTLAGFVFLFLGAVLTGASNYLERYMHPFFFLTPLWLLWVAAQDAPARRPVAIGAVLLAVTLAVVPIRAVYLARAMGPDCNHCRLAVPYEGLAQELEARGFGGGTLIVMDRNDGGNLRRFLPEARIVSLRRPYHLPPVRPQDLTAPAVVVWRPARRAGLWSLAAPAIRQIDGQVVGNPRAVHVPWTPLGSASEPQAWEWRIAFVQPSAGSRR
ncbi:glycosyltransferase family 39 protein [Methyloceanibacter sp. wino2]|uniref:glycosyltransferase family 39 protein n=1 Tax=Methyloceanibacter sp. wino2 TaxID=2170729 RepID=UPI000D3E35D2|nr:glycosyltransferase family 39 protein [Methyloceanibacter sp. wino2]